MYVQPFHICVHVDCTSDCSDIYRFLWSGTCEHALLHRQLFLLDVPRNLPCTKQTLENVGRAFWSTGVLLKCSRSYACICLTEAQFCLCKVSSWTFHLILIFNLQSRQLVNVIMLIFTSLELSWECISHLFTQMHALEVYASWLV